MFVNLLKPRWRHTSAAVRSIATIKLNPNKKSDADKLRQLALHDPDFEVRATAISRLEDFTLLSQLLEEGVSELHDNSKLANQAAARLTSLTEQQKIQLKQLESLQNESAFSLLICQSQNEQLHQTLLPHIQSETLLAEIAMFAPLAATRQMAATKLSDPGCLEKVRSFARDHDKLVYRITRDTQKRTQQLQLEKQAKLRECHHLLNSLRCLIYGSDQQHFSARFHALQSQWNELADPQLSDLREAYQELVSQAELIIQQQAIQEAKAVEAEAARALASQQLRLCQNRLDTLLQLLSQYSIVKDEAIQYLDTLNDEINQLITTHAEQLSDAEHQAINKITLIINACQLLQQQSSDFYRLIEQADAAHDLSELQTSQQALKQALQQHDWPAVLKGALDLDALTTAEQRTRERLQQLKQQDKAALAVIEEQLAALEGHIKQGETLKAQKKLDSLGKQIKKQPLSESLQQQFRSLSAQVNEMEEWQQFAAISKKEQLCIAMEALIDSKSEPAVLAEQIRELQQRWKLLDKQTPAPAKHLWERFHAASRQAYLPCDTYYKELSRLRAWNLSQRELICQHLETYFSALDWSQPDWKALEQILKKAKIEWRDFSPVDRAPGKLLQTRFQRLIDQAEQALQEHRNHCATLKQALVDEAFELTKSEDLVAAAEGIKTLQQAWKNIDSTAKHKERKLWEAFRRHGDQVFSRIRERSQQLEGEPATEQCSAENPETAARLLCIRLEILFNQPSPDNDQYLRMEYQMQRLQQALEPCSDSERKVAVQQVIDEWHEAGFADQFEALQQRFNRLLTHND